MPEDAPTISATITYVQAQPSTMRSVSVISGIALGRMTFHSTFLRLVPSVYETSISEECTLRMLVAVIRTSCGRLPRMMMATFSLSPMPIQKMNRGMKAEAGM